MHWLIPVSRTNKKDFMNGASCNVIREHHRLNHLPLDSGNRNFQASSAYRTVPFENKNGVL